MGTSIERPFQDLHFYNKIMLKFGKLTSFFRVSTCLGRHTCGTTHTHQTINIIIGRYTHIHTHLVSLTVTVIVPNQIRQNLGGNQGHKVVWTHKLVSQVTFNVAEDIVQNLHGVLVPDVLLTPETLIHVVRKKRVKIVFHLLMIVHVLVKIAETV
jgi:hypothetical protein